MNIQFQPNHTNKNHFIEQMSTNNMKTTPLNNVTKFQGKSRKSSSNNKFVGVRQRPSGRWVAEIKDTTQKIRMWLGTFETAEAAARAYDEAACLLRGSNTRTNFVVNHVSPNSPLASRIKNLLKNKKLESQKSNAISDNHHIGDIKNNNPLALASPNDANNITIPPINTLGTTFPTSLNLSTNSPSTISTQLHANFEYRTLDNFCLQQENKMCTDVFYRPQLNGFVGNYELVDHSSLVQCGMHQGGYEHNLNPPTLEVLPLIGLSQDASEMPNSTVLAPQSIGSDLLEMQKIKTEDELPASFDMASSSNGIYEYFDFLHDPSVDNLWDLAPFSSYFC